MAVLTAAGTAPRERIASAGYSTGPVTLVYREIIHGSNSLLSRPVVFESQYPAGVVILEYSIGIDAAAHAPKLFKAGVLMLDLRKVQGKVFSPVQPALKKPG
jgi:hypothetical protein